MESKAERSLSDFNNELKLKGFKVYRLDDSSRTPLVYSRKDFYKICLTTGKSNIHYADRSYETDGTVLFFGNPDIPYSWETLSRTYEGYTCLFSEDFMKPSERSESLQQSPLFRFGGTPILSLSLSQRQFLNGVFEKMIEEQTTAYPFKDELIRNYIHLIVHEALKMSPSHPSLPEKNAAMRITNVFLELLERQFPVERIDQPLKLRTPQDYARVLSVHVNHLNRSLKETTGRSTSEHIAGRMTKEARAILKHTDWNISDVAYALGFQYPSYFNNFFKRMTGSSPKVLRNLET
ncbi:MAG: helix-turn-helix domain-containing protein [Bacteroidales bacterium]